MENIRLSLLPACLLLAAAVLHGCGHNGGTQEVTPAESPGLCEQPWLLKSLTIDGREHRTGLLWRKLMRDRPYFSCDPLGYVRGNSGSNPYIGKLLRSGSRFSWTRPPTVSPMAERRDSNDLEQDFLRALSQTDNLSFEGNSLILESSDSATRIEFQPAKSSPP
ncbi:META domain-containing protein [Microbulbifer yueqingensis]|uniref:Heat shock protein HslJ n=1 Tax=Microbulbifer yueqingensis TaxID=658219 RepID=A0A1G9DK76_9GAMM|nr:META domain-containing protein [Microbulbifer yueqingensis]SDK64291.1 Heat shock protein HslJ [Microbulbifer yueqingensis]